MRIKAEHCKTKGRHIVCPKCHRVAPDWCGDEDTQDAVEEVVITPPVPKKPTTRKK